MTPDLVLASQLVKEYYAIPITFSSKLNTTSWRLAEQAESVDLLAHVFR